MATAQLIDVDILRAYMTVRIAPVRALGVTVEAIDPVTITAPLDANINDKGSGFAGSLFSVAALAGWAFVMRWCAVERVAAEVALQNSKARFLAPARADLRAVASAPEAAVLGKLKRMLARSRRGRVEIAVAVTAGDAKVLTFNGTYAVLVIGDGPQATPRIE